MNPNTRVKDLTNEEIVKIRAVLERDYRVEGDLRRDISLGSQETCRYRKLQGDEAPFRTSCERSENENKCANPQGSKKSGYG